MGVLVLLGLGLHGRVRALRIGFEISLAFVGFFTGLTGLHAQTCVGTSDIACTNSGAIGPFSTIVLGGPTVTNINTSTGSASSIYTLSESIAITRNDGLVTGDISTNRGTTGDHLPDGGYAETINTGHVTGKIRTRVGSDSFNTDVITINSGIVDSVIITTSFNTIHGKMITINSGRAFAIQNVSLADSIDSIIDNSGVVSSIITSYVFSGSSSVTNSGIAGAIESATDGGGGFVQAINSGRTGSIEARVSGGSGNAYALNTGIVTGNIYTHIAGDGTGTATTDIGAGASAFDVTTETPTGSATTTNGGAVNSLVTRIADGGAGDATTNNLATGTVAAGISTLSGIGIATTNNAGIVYGNVSANASGGAAVVNNSGRIFGTVMAYGLTSATITNSGLIDAASASGTAINLSTVGSGTPSALNILPGSRIVGKILLAGAGGGPGTNVNVAIGRGVSSVLTFGDASGAKGLVDTGATVSVTNGVPYVVAGNSVATVDPTSFAIADRNLFDLTRVIGAQVSSQLSGQAGIGNSSPPLGFASTGNVATDMVREAFAGIRPLNDRPRDQGLLGNPGHRYDDGTSVWARGFGGQRVQGEQELTPRSVTSFYGGMLGVDRAVRSDIKLGVFAGGGTLKSDIEQNAGSTTSQFGFAGIYGRATMAASFLDFSLIAGGSSNDTLRGVANNLSASGFDTARASYGGWFVSPELAYGTSCDLGFGLSFTPVARIRYLAAGFGGYSETGSIADLSVASRVTQNLEERGELSLTRIIGAGADQRLQLGGFVGVISQQRLSGGNVNASLLAQSLSFAAPGASTLYGGYAGASIEWRHVKGWSLFAGTEFTAMTDTSRTITATGGLRMRF